MENIEEQTELLLESTSTRTKRRSVSTWQRLRQFGQQLLAMVWFFLMQIHDFLREDNNNTYQSQREQAVATPENTETDTGYGVETRGEDPVESSFSITNVGSGTIINRILPGLDITSIRQIDSDTNHSIVLVTASGQTTPTLAPSYSAPLPRRSPFHTDNHIPLVFSYAGETVDAVREISDQIENTISTPNSSPSVFFAPDFQDELSQLNAMDILQKIYREASLVVVFLSNAYPDSRYCRAEWRTITDRFLGDQTHQEEKKRLMLVKFGEYSFEALGLVKNDFYVDGTKMNRQEVAELIIKRFRKVQNLST